MIALTLAVLLAQDAVPAFEQQPYTACVEAATAPPAVERDGGWWLPHPRGERLACLLETCEQRRLQLERTPVPAAPWLWLVAGVVIGAFGGGWLVHTLMK